MPPSEVRVFQAGKGDSAFVDWLKDLKKSEPRAFRKCLYLLLALEREGSALRRPLADSLRDGIRELRAKVGTVNYRILYSFMGSNIAIVSHGATKESEVSDADIELAIVRVKLAKKSPLTHTVVFDKDKL